MDIALIDVDGHNFPNLALMKISAYHKAQGHNVKFYDPLFDKPDLCYASKVFTFTPDYDYFPECKVVKGGTGYDIKSKLHIDIENTFPDYSLYNIDYAIGFLTRGCIRKCEWCIVPEKEGNIRPNKSILDICGNFKKAVLIDNNFLALRDYAICQLKLIAKYKIKIDFNQALDARLIDDEIAYYMSRCKWLAPVRMSCDTISMIKYVEDAVKLLRNHKCTPSRYSVFVLVKDIENALNRVNAMKNIECDPFAMPFRDFKNNTPISQQHKDFARWVNHKAIFKTVKWEDYKS